MARYNRLPNLTSSIGQVASFSGGLAVVIRPPASKRIATPAATSLYYIRRGTQPKNAMSKSKKEE
jgi:hypothetical protein